MSSPLQQIAIAIVTAGCISFGSSAFYAGATNRQLETNTEKLATYEKQMAKIPVMESSIANMQGSIANMQKRLDTYENLVVNGQKEILKEISAMNILSARSDERIGAIEVDISEIKDRIDK